MAFVGGRKGAAPALGVPHTMSRRLGERMLVRSLLVGLVALLIAAPAAGGGAYSHYACTLPNGAIGSLWQGDSGWRVVGDAQMGFSLSTDCRANGYFGARLTRAETTNNRSAFGWGYYAPVDTKVTGFRF